MTMSKKTKNSQKKQRIGHAGPRENSVFSALTGGELTPSPWR